MRLGYFAMPMHPVERPWDETLDEDREAVILADKLGFHDAFIGEHLTDRAENITNCMIFLATLIHETKQIKLATGTSNLSQMHPVLVAAHAAMFDHLSRGRFILGISPGACAPTRRRSAISTQTATRCSPTRSTSSWRSGSASRPTTSICPATATRCRPHRGARHRSRHLPQALPEAAAGDRRHRGGALLQGVMLMGKRDFHPLSANFLQAKWAQAHWANYAEGKACRHQKPDIADWRVARTVFVADDDKAAARYGRGDAKSPYRFYYQQLLAKFSRLGRLRFSRRIGSSPTARSRSTMSSTAW